MALSILRPGHPNLSCAHRTGIFRHDSLYLLGNVDRFYDVMCSAQLLSLL